MTQAGADPRYLAAEDALWAAFGAPSVRRHEVPVPDAGYTCHVRELGDPDGPVILFLHGSPNCGAVWAPLAVRLPDYRCLLVDGPGYGLSTFPTRRLRAPEHAWALPLVLDHLGIGTCHLVGSSYGSCVAMRFLADHPTRVLKVIHQSHPGIVPGQPGYGMAFYLRFFSAMAWLKLGALTPARTRPLWRSIGHGPALASGAFPAAVLEWYAALLRGTRTLEADAALTAAVLSGLSLNTEAFVRAEELGASQVPTTWYWGEHETLGGLDVARAFAAKVPGSTVVEAPGCGHLPWLDDVPAAERHLREFFA